jgi:hypothetical protein
MLFTGAVLACIQMLDVIGAKAYGAGFYEIALIRSGMGIGMIASFLVAARIMRGRRVPFVTWPQTVSRCLLLSLAILPWLPEGLVLPYFCLCAVASSALEHLTLPARLTLYRHNYPMDLRPLFASRLRQAQMLMILLVGAGLGLLMDWNSPRPEGVGTWLETLVRGDILPWNTILKYGVPFIAALSFTGVLLFARIREGARVNNLKENGSGVAPPGFRAWIAVLAGNRSFLVFEIAYFLFGFGNLMTLPLMVILITKPEYGIEASYFEAMLLQAVIWQLAILLAAPLMGKLVQRFNPLLLRGVFTLIFAGDLLLMYLGFRTASITPLYFGKMIKGISNSGGMLITELGPMYFAKSREQASTYIGIHTVLTGIRASVSPWAGAALAGIFTLGSTILIGAGLQILAAAVLILYFLAARHEPLRIHGAEGGTAGRPSGPVT